VHNVSGIDILMMRITVLFVVVVLMITPVGGTHGLCSIILNDLLCINVLEDTVVLHSVVESRMKLTRTLQGFVVVFLVIMVTGKSFDCIDFMVIPTRPLAP